MIVVEPEETCIIELLARDRHLRSQRKRRNGSGKVDGLIRKDLGNLRLRESRDRTAKAAKQRQYVSDLRQRQSSEMELFDFLARFQFARFEQPDVSSLLCRRTPPKT